MKKTLLSFLTLAALAHTAQTIVITDVNIIPISTNTLMQHQDVFIKNGMVEKITDHVPSSSAAKNTKIVNGEGKYLMPGLADMHVHLPDGSEPITKQQVYDYYLQSGVTALRSMRGENWHPKHRDSIAKGLIVAPMLYISYPLPEKDSLLSKKDIDAIVKLIKTNHFDFAKYVDGIDDAKMKEVSKALKDNGIVLAGHAYKDVATSIQLGFRSIEHISPLLEAYQTDSLNFDKLLSNMKAGNVSYCPTESFSKITGLQFSLDENMSRNGMAIIDTNLANSWKRNYVSYLTMMNKRNVHIVTKQTKNAKNEITTFNGLLRRMLKAGVNVLLSPDNCLFNVPGYAMAEEMKAYREAGIGNYDILKIATLNAANFFNASKKWGTIAKGKDADLILLDKNPLEDIENIKSVRTTIVKGKVLFEKK